MKKVFLFLTMCLLNVATLSAQQKLNGDYFSVSAPNSNWYVQDIDMEGLGQCGTIFNTNGDNAVGIGVVVCAIDAIEDLDNYLDLQCEADNPIFTDAKFGPTEKDQFMDFNGKSREFTSRFEGANYTGSMIVFNTTKSTYYVLVYTSLSNPSFDEVFKSLVIKK